MGPDNFGALRPRRHDLAHHQVVADLLQHEAGEDRQDLQGDAVAELVPAFEQGRLPEAERVAVRPQLRRAVFGVGVLAIEHRIADMVGAGLADDNAALLGQPVHPEGGEEQVEDAGVVRVPDVLGVELPVVAQDLGIVAEHLCRLRQNPVDPAANLRPEIIVQRRRPMVERPEDQPGPGRGAQGPQVMVAAPEGRRHPPAALDALLEGDADQLAGLVVGPGVVDAGEGAGVAEALQAQLRAAVGAAVLEGVDPAVARPHDDDRHVADRRRLVVAGFGNLAFEGEIVPDRPHEDAFALTGVDRRIVVERERDVRVAGLRPDRGRRVCRGRGRPCGIRHGDTARRAGALRSVSKGGSAAFRRIPEGSPAGPRAASRLVGAATAVDAGP